MNPDFIPSQFRANKTVAAWLLECWIVGFADGNHLANLLCKPLTRKGEGAVFPSDVDDLLRSLRQPEKGELGTIKGAGWLIQGKWLAHQSAFGRSRAALIGLEGTVHRTDDLQARFHASCFGFEPNRACEAYRAWIAAVRDTVEPLPSPMAILKAETKAATEGGAFAVGKRVRYSPKFLASIGMANTQEARREYTILRFRAGRNGAPDLVKLDEDVSPETLAMYSAEELAADPLLRKVSVLTCNLKPVK